MFVDGLLSIVLPKMVQRSLQITSGRDKNTQKRTRGSLGAFN
jgi:hypothetical protein